MSLVSREAFLPHFWLIFLGGENCIFIQTNFLKKDKTMKISWKIFWSNFQSCGRSVYENIAQHKLILKQVAKKQQTPKLPSSNW